MIPHPRIVTFIGLNPSTADETEDDPTIRRCIGYAKRWGFQGMIMLNIFAFRATDPKEMMTASEPIGKRNNEVIRITSEDSHKVVACWGIHGAYLNRDLKVQVLLRPILDRVFCFGKTLCGQPKHPLHLKRNTELELLVKDRHD